MRFLLFFIPHFATDTVAVRFVCDNEDWIEAEIVGDIRNLPSPDEYDCVGRFSCLRFLGLGFFGTLTLEDA